MPTLRRPATSVKQHTIAAALDGHPGRLGAVTLLVLFWFGTTASLVETADGNVFLVSFKILAVGTWVAIQIARVLLGSFRLDGAWPMAKEFGWTIAVTNGIISAISGPADGQEIHLVVSELTTGTPVMHFRGVDVLLSAMDGLPPFLRLIQIQRIMLVGALLRTFMCAIGWVTNDA